MRGGRGGGERGEGRGGERGEGRGEGRGRRKNSYLQCFFEVRHSIRVYITYINIHEWRREGERREKGGEGNKKQGK